jgi:hypothetical protein
LYFFLFLFFDASILSNGYTFVRQSFLLTFRLFPYYTEQSSPPLISPSAFSAH